MTFTLRLARHRHHQPPRPTRPRWRGFTMIELLTAVVVMGTLGRIAVPNVYELELRARAQEVVGNLAIIHLAAVDYRQDQGTWPDDAYAGSVPDGLEPYLPAGFDLRGQGYRLDWEHWRIPDGLPDSPATEELVALSVVTDEAALGHAVTDLLGGALAHYILDDRYTFVLVSR